MTRKSQELNMSRSFVEIAFIKKRKIDEKMNRKFLAVLLMVLSLFSFSVNARGAKGTFEMPYNSYNFVEMEGGVNDLIRWSFKSTGNKVELHLLDSEGFMHFEDWPNRYTIEHYGDQLTGQVNSASGEFNPKREDTWYFVFVNAGREEVTATVSYDIALIPSYYVLLPVMIVVIVAIVCLPIAFFVLEKLKKKRKETDSSQIMISQDHPRAPEEPQKEKSSKTEFCPTCGNKIVNPEAQFCDKCGANFSRL